MMNNDDDSGLKRGLLNLLIEIEVLQASWRVIPPVIVVCLAFLIIRSPRFEVEGLLKNRVDLDKWIDKVEKILESHNLHNLITSESSDGDRGASSELESDSTCDCCWSGLGIFHKEVRTLVG